MQKFNIPKKENAAKAFINVSINVCVNEILKIMALYQFRY